jgi:DNA-binding transcriptional LysR family regulator
MIDQTPDWDLYRSFLGVVRDGSLSGAARRLGLTQPTIGRHIDALEAILGLSLFTRSPAGLRPTESALDLVPHAEAMAAAAAALTRTASAEAGAERGTVRLTASEIMGCEILPPILAAFRRAHPAIVLELALTNRTEDLLRRDADIAVRMIRPAQAALVARRIGVSPIGLFAHRDYLDHAGTPRGIEDLAVHTMIGFDQDDRSFRNIGGVLAQGLSRERFSYRCDSDLGQLAALRAGIGIGGAQVALAARTADLVPVLADEVLFDMEVWLAMHEDLKASRRVRLLFDHLTLELQGFVKQGGAA